MFDPSPIMQGEVSSWTLGEQPMKGMVFATKLAVRHALTWYAVRENFSFKTEHSDSERLMVSCEDDSCPWSIRAICRKGDNVWKIAKCKGPHTCNKIQNAHDGRMIDSAFLAYVREDPVYKIKKLRKTTTRRYLVLLKACSSVMPLLVTQPTLHLPPPLLP